MEEYKEINTTRGVYLPFGAIVEKFGIHYNRWGAIKQGL